MKETHTYFESWALAGLYGLVSTTAYSDHSYCVSGAAQLSHSTEKESLSLEFTGPVEHFGQIIFKLQVPRNKILGQEFSGRPENQIISIFRGCIVWIEKSVMRVTDRHHEACRVMPNIDPE